MSKCSRFGEGSVQGQKMESNFAELTEVIRACVGPFKTGCKTAAARYGLVKRELGYVRGCPRQQCQSV